LDNDGGYVATPAEGGSIVEENLKHNISACNEQMNDNNHICCSPHLRHEGHVVRITTESIQEHLRQVLQDFHSSHKAQHVIVEVMHPIYLA